MAHLMAARGSLRGVTDHATEHARVNATVARCFEVVTDFEHYPSWAADIKAAEVVRRDEQGRGIEVLWRAAAMGRSTSVRLEYDYTDAPRALRWKLLDGDVLRRYDGHYLLDPASDDPDSTEVEYQLSVDLVVPLPGFVKRRAETKIIKAALPDLKAYIEASRPASA
jgi:ribosome-associated toxin RatA of RatAB toxin-antitoxin module